MKEHLKDSTKTILFCLFGFLAVSVFLIVLLGIVAYIPGIDISDNKHVAENIIKVHAASVIILTILLICVAWLQLGDLNKTSRADFLLRIDDRYSSPEILKARVIIQELYRKTNEPGQPYIEDVATQKIAQGIKNIGQDGNKSEEFIYLLNLLDFLETIAYFSNKKYISAKEVNELLGNTILFNYKIFKEWIYYRRSPIQMRSATPRFSHDLLNTSNGVL